MKRFKFRNSFPFFSPALFLVSLSLSAAPPAKQNTLGKVLKFKDYTIQYSPQSSGDNNQVLIFDSRGKEIGAVDQVLTSHYHPFELHKGKFYFLHRTSDPKSPNNWTDELWMTDLKTRKQDKVYSQKGLDFRVSPTGEGIFCRAENEFFHFDLKSKTKKVFASPEERGKEEQVTLLDWSEDGKRFWFGDGAVGGWSQLGLIENQKTRWFHYTGEQSENALEPNNGWLAQTDSSFVYDDVQESQHRKTKTKDSLVVIDVFTGKKIVVAQSPRRFKVQFNPDRSLEYEVDGKRRNLTAEEIKAKFK